MTATYDVEDTMLRSRRVATVVLTLLVGLLHATTPRAQDRRSTLSPSDVFKKASESVVTITTADGQGSGVLVDTAGVIITNLHVVAGASRAGVRLANGDVYDNVDVVEFDSRKDLILLKIRGFKLPTAELGDSDRLAVGDKVYAIGAPKGLELSLSEGIVSGLRDSGDGYRVVQTSAAISAGSSGGGLFDDNGRLVAVTTFKIRGGENLNFAVPINYVRGMLGTTARLTLTELADQLKSESNTTQPLSGNTGVPRLAPVYRAVDGSFVVMEQDGAQVRASFTNPDGYVYGSSTVVWVPAEKAFKGSGVLDTVCGQIDTRIWKAPVQQEIHIVNDFVIRERWTQPTRVNCTRGRVDAAVWQEGFWYVPPR